MFIKLVDPFPAIREPEEKQITFIRRLKFMPGLTLL
jgi:hypothetical protein